MNRYSRLLSGETNKPVIFTKDGRVSKRNRVDYSQTPKAPKSLAPWETNNWLQEIRNPDVADPKSRMGKKFRRRFRVPYQTYQKIVHMCRNTGETDFNYPEVHMGEPTIPLELKILTVLRVLGGGLKFNDAAEMCGYMSETEINSFFRRFCLLFRLHFEHTHIRPHSAEEAVRSIQYIIKIHNVLPRRE